MSENALSAALVFALLAGGAAAIGSELVSPRLARAAEAAPRVVTLPAVTVTGQRHPAVTVAADTVAASAARRQ